MLTIPSLSLSPWLGMAGVVAALLLATAVLHRLQQRYAPPAEWTRKGLHVVMGLVTLSFPWVFHDRWPVVLLVMATTALLVAVRCVPALRGGVGRLVHGVARPSYGELVFPSGVGLAFVLAPSPAAYAGAILLLTVSDTAAAFAGLAWGRHRYLTLSEPKSYEGSAAFFVTAAACLYGILSLSGTGLADRIVLTLLLATLGTLIEAASWRGLDNLFLPAGLALAAGALAPLEAEVLLGHLAVLAALLCLMALSSRLRPLTSSAVGASALAGAAAWMAGGPVALTAATLLYAGGILSGAHLLERPTETLLRARLSLSP